MIFLLLGVSNLIPAPASKPSILGYYAHCSITHVSTIILWVVGGLIYWPGERREK